MEMTNTTPIKSDTRKITVIIPAYNEEKTLPILLKKLVEKKLNNYIEKIIVVDDGSTDTTREISLRMQEQYPVIQTFSMARNSGKADAVRYAMKFAGEIILIQDADLEYDPENIPNIVLPLITGKSDFVFGSRFIPRNPKLYPLNKYAIANYFITFTVNKLCRRNISDAMTGYKAFKKEVFESFNCIENNFDQCIEITVKSVNSNYRILDVPITYYPRNKKQGKKIGFKDFISVIKTIWKYRSYRV